MNCSSSCWKMVLQLNKPLIWLIMKLMARKINKRSVFNNALYVGTAKALGASDKIIGLRLFFRGLDFLPDNEDDNDNEW